MNSQEIRENADRILYEYGLLDMLKPLGTPDGKTVWFHGFEAVVNGELWNVDLWFFDQETIQSAEQYCDNIVQTASAAQKEQIIIIKQELIKREKSLLAHGA